MQSSAATQPSSGLLTTLLRHDAGDEAEARDLAEIIEFVRIEPRPFARNSDDSPPARQGHLTGSAIVVSADGEKVVLLHHAKLDRWLQPGGHGEPGERLGEQVALREAREETGINGLSLHPDAPQPLDVDVHDIPGRADEEAHRHLDLRYLLVAPAGARLKIDPRESLAVEWFAWEQLGELGLDQGLLRALAKARLAIIDAATA
ncbi:MAG TPA: NUDIX domain-containing protein [Deltaproteobacteria bacterium]|nr:NUDIX domain-containing protein [Candidatus Binatota bacterium]HIL13217.1 NUDIX domain-containing protein [Deltaproteobacteria bacterium]